MPRPKTSNESLLKRVTVDPVTGCWIWTGNLNDAGYGRVQIDGHLVRAHRAIYELCIGPIPEGQEAHHLCDPRDGSIDYRKCCNPTHVEPMTPAQHAATKRHPQRESDECKRGHAYPPVNTRIRVRNGLLERVCRECKNENARAHRRQAPKV